MTETNRWRVYSFFMSVDEFGGNDDHLPPPTTVLSPTTTTHSLKLQNQGTYYQNRTLPTKQPLYKILIIFLPSSFHSLDCITQSSKCSLLYLWSNVQDSGYRNCPFFLQFCNLPNMVCQPLWNSYLLRYSQTKDHEVTIVLSTIYTSGWVGIGFSRDGKMLNSSCIVGWLNLEGQGRIKQYHIKGYTPSEIKADRGELPLTNVPPYVAVQGATIYLSFQMKFNTTLKTQPILLAFSTKTPHHHRLTVHEDKTTIYFDFSSGKTDSSADSSPSIFKDRRTHGTLAVLGWGLFLPTGAILARYLNHRDRVWYYFHVSIQFIGFLFGVAAVVVGVSLYSKMHAMYPAHKGIGIFVLVMTILQVLAFFTRPSSDSKYRRYWNWYHNWLGRICLFFGAVNIVLGIHIAGAGAGWKIGYGFLLGSILVIVIVLEALLRLRKSAEADNHPAFSMNSIDREISL